MRPFALAQECNYPTTNISAIKCALKWQTVSSIMHLQLTAVVCPVIHCHTLLLPLRKVSVSNIKTLVSLTMHYQTASQWDSFNWRQSRRKTNSALKQRLQCLVLMEWTCCRDFWSGLYPGRSILSR